MKRATFWGLVAAAVFAGRADAGAISLTATVRDFSISHPDFEDTNIFDPGIVENVLGADGKPVYAGQAGNPSTSGKANFDQWYRDVPGINQTTSISLTANETAPGSGLYQYVNNDFFPVDDQLFGNEGLSHNFHFTTEIHTQFTYLGGEVFSFTGDDDVWVFIDDLLRIDLGGEHGPLTGSVDLDALGLVKGKSYDLDLFHAERHTTGSNFAFTTSARLVDDPNGPAVPEPGTLALLGLGGIGFFGRSLRRRFAT